MHGTAVHFAAETGLEIQDVLLHGHETALSPAEMRKTAELVRKESTPL